MVEMRCDAAVVDAGDAVLSAAPSACERGVSVLVLQRAAEAENGGNSRFTAGAIRTVDNDAGELVGGRFYFSDPGGTGLLSVAVFGRLAGSSAGQAATLTV